MFMHVACMDDDGSSSSLVAHGLALPWTDFALTRTRSLATWLGWGAKVVQWSTSTHRMRLSTGTRGQATEQQQKRREKEN